jgi:alpha-L-fucosidase
LRDVQVEGPRRIGSGELWEDDRASLEEHETPKWWSEAKFGIFLHIGLYSVPAWVGPSLVLSVSLGMY